MNTKKIARELALALCSRSPCRVGMAAVLSDRYGVFSWGWNHPSADGDSIHAERHAFLRANPKRLKGAALIVAGVRKKSLATVYAKPCSELCLPLAKRQGIAKVEYLTKYGWKFLKLN